MRFIDIAFVRPPENFDQKAAEAQADGEENIGSHSDVWRDCKASLKQASFDKCYYCEMKDIRSDGAVDHYRPKSKYKWAAFHFDNFRFACTYCNSRRKDQKTGEIGGKGVRDIKRRLDQRAELSAFSKRVLQSYKNKPLVEQILAAA